MHVRLQLVALFLVLFSFANAQTRLSGKIVNAKNEPIPGVSIKIAGSQEGTASDIEGRYSLILSVGKKYTVEFSAIGFVGKSVNDVEVGPGLDNDLNIVLEVEPKNISGVTVRSTTRRQENTAALLAFQKNNISLSSGLAADFIRRTPDKNTGEALKRVSGASVQDNRFVVIRGLSDRYNAAIINNAQLPSSEPDKKAFSFDVIPAALIDNIIVNKTATPDLTGEFAGGIVQINTKDVPTKNQLSLGISFGFNTQSAFKDFLSNKRNNTDWLGFDDGTRDLPQGFPNTPQEYRALGGTNTGVQQQIELSRLFNNDVYGEKKSTALPTQTYSLTWSNVARCKDGGTFGTIVSLQYRSSMLKYEVERKLHEDNGNVVVKLNDDQNRYGVNIGSLANFTYVKGQHKISFKNLFNQLFEDNYYTRSGVSNDRIQDINFRSSVLNQRSLYSAQLEGEHQLNSNGVKLRWNGNFSYNFKTQPDLRTSAYFRAKGSGDPYEYNDDDTRRFFSDLKDYSYGGNGSLTFPFTMGEDKQSFKVGGSVLIRVRDFDSRIMRYEPSNPNQFDPAKNFLPFDKIFAPENIAVDGFKILDFTNNQDEYFAVSANDGIYGMFDNKFGEKVRLVWGVRAEYFEQFLRTEDVSKNEVIVNTEKWDVLPSLNFTYSPNVRNAIRASASRTVARPEFREIAPFSFYDYEMNYGVNGNPDLKRTAILNGDLRYEFYPRGGEAITIGTFYKSFNDPIELRLDPSSVLDRRNYGYSNADKAYSIGAEFEVRKGLGFINSSFETFSLFANLTYTYSEVTLASTSGTGGTTSSTRPLQGQSPYLVNAGLQYNSKNTVWSGSLLYNRIGQRLALVGLPDLGFRDIYERPRDQVDIQLAKKIFQKKGELKIIWADLLNPAYMFYENVDNAKAYSASTDRLFSSYTPGSTITVGFTYDFTLGKNK